MHVVPVTHSMCTFIVERGRTFVVRRLRSSKVWKASKANRVSNHHSPRTLVFLAVHLRSQTWKPLPLRQRFAAVVQVGSQALVGSAIRAQSCSALVDTSIIHALSKKRWVFL